MKRLNFPMYASAVAICSQLTLGFFELRKNRILSGESITAHESMGGLLLVIVLLETFIFILSISRNKDVRRLIPLSALAAIITLLIGTSAYSASIAAPMRLSLGAGFYMSFVMLMLCFSEVKGALKYLPLAALIGFIVFHRLDSLSIMQEYQIRRESFLREVVNHLVLAVGSSATAYVIGIFMTRKMLRNKSFEKFSFTFMNLSQTVPTLSLIGLLMIPLGFLSSKFELLRNLGIKGIGFTPAFIVLVLFSLLPIVSANISAIRSLERDIVTAARGMGMDEKQIHREIEMKLTLPLRLSGLRIALTQSFGNSIVAGLVGGGGLGSVIFLGLAQSAPDLVLLGSIPVIVMAFATDAIMSQIIYRIKERLV